MKTIKLLIIPVIITICMTMLCACSGSGNSSSPVSVAVSANGGTGSNGSGGSGGQFFAESYGAIRVLKSGSADASFTMPAQSSYNFGDSGYTVSGSEQILLDTAVPAGYTGLYVMDNNFHKTSDWNLYKADGTGSAGSPNVDYQITGLWVPSGATLTINADSNYYTSDYGAFIVLTNDVVIDGTLQTAAGYNYIWFENAPYAFEPLYTSDSSPSYLVPLSANIVVTGTVTTSGAENGWIEFDAANSFFNSGTLDASGSDNSTGDGNNSAGIGLYAMGGSVYSKGTIKADGGNGGNGSGGAGADVIEIIGGYAEDIYVDPVNGGCVLLGGNVEARGGNGTGGSGGAGGGGNDFSFIVAMGGDLIVNTTFTLNGGNGSGSGTGGDAGGLFFYVFGTDYRRVGVFQISGSFNLSGGNGVNGGAGGWAYFFSSYWDFLFEHAGNGVGQAPDIQLLGFSNINLNGGNGTTTGGSGSKNGTYSLFTFASRDNYDHHYLPAYPIVSEANISARGGDASAAGGTGGTGGYVELATDDDDYYSTSITTITQSGTIDNSGGNATASGGTGGDANEIYLGSGDVGYCWNVTTTGILTANGGNGALQGGNGGYINLYSDEVPTVYTLANLSVNGGTGATPGVIGEADVDGTAVIP
jgi:hypothetical protein